MADFNIYFPKLMQYEGGLSNPNGHPTYHSIDQVENPDWEGFSIINSYANPTNDVLAANSDLQQMVKDFYKANFWDKWLADQITNQSLAELVVDWEVNSGVTGIKIPQRILGVTPDGIVGNQTISAMNSADQPSLFAKIWDAHKSFYITLVQEHPNDAQFLKGWETRLDKQVFVNNM